MIQVSDIPQGGFFRLKGGSYTYIRLSESAILYHEMNPNFIYGVLHNGNMKMLDPGTMVHVMCPGDFMSNIEDSTEWEKAVGSKNHA